MSLIINLLEDLKPGQLKEGETICPIFSRVEPVSEGFNKSSLNIKSILFVCIGKACGMYYRCANKPGIPGEPRS